MKIVKVALSMAVMVMVSGRATAAVTENAVVLASVSAVLSVALAGSPTNFVAVAAGSTTAGATPINVLNDGSGVVETFELSLTEPADWTAGTPASDVFRMQGAFDADGLLIVFGAANHELTTTPTLSTVTRFAGDANGVAVPYNNSRDLWLQFEAPTLSTVTAVQSITVVVTATP